MGFAPGGGGDVMLSMVRPHLEKAMKTAFVPGYTNRDPAATSP